MFHSKLVCRTNEDDGDHANGGNSPTKDPPG
eukprot:CAMPEP_0116040296 /NCGR_PEP_ID=MMETSP0321-20121206/24271_1 /TAXON_ID=163516 /ORGANISM="Leptocylindrus danicus var. danicus, Strain B650" /LENGTH=30 /DNA_ID= /DNA_START= /DNA_END= /DNA_ORIENTATION=